MDRFERIGSITSMTIGLPVGLFAIGLVFLLPVTMTGEGLTTIYMFIVFGYPTLAFLLSFVVMLWIGGKILGREIRNNKRFLVTTFNYSSIINIPCWTIFVIVYILTNGPSDHSVELINNVPDNSFGLYLPYIAGLISTLVTPFTIGLIIYKVTKMKVEKFASA